MSVIDTLLPSSAVEYVGVYTPKFVQVFPNARPLKVVVKLISKLMEHPVENGATITDHRVIQPIEIEMSVMLNSADYQEVYKDIRQYYLNATLLTVQTRSAVYSNMLIQQLPHEEDPEQFSAIPVAITFKQVLFAMTKFGVVPKKKVNTSTVNRGTQQAQAPKPQQTTIAQDIYRKLGGS